MTLPLPLFSAAQPLPTSTPAAAAAAAARAHRCKAPITALQVDFDSLTPRAKGSFGDIFFATLSDTREPIVLKRAGQARHSRKLLIAERNVNKSLNVKQPHPTHWPKFLGETNHNSQSFLVWRGERSGVTTLHEMLFDRAPNALPVALGLPPSAALSARTAAPVLHVALFKLLTDALLRAVREVHRSGFVHRDIKPQNILVTRATAPSAPHRLKLIDFGSAKNMQPWATMTDRTPVTLDPLFGAPERGGVLFNAASKQLKTKFDVFSIGMIAVAAAVPALRGESQLRMFRSALERCDYDLELLEAQWRRNGGGGGDAAPLFACTAPTEVALKSLVRSMLRKQPHNRASVQTALYRLQRL
ncbi:Serine/threonine-protein kinase STN7, chloroplastic [Gracilariopsis chorda]|uniref:Serine/threonine-protein kinase STN7, chloroplastic n=1 Tax=Gracilariopsis chorda TaxID=448386 RepID=A0A2V3IZ25_9FLOR|nr:Serine/threonine-protein kinase STN7, chloroplastic [Gracilariopsis chorda]|eukprot:PXF46937.1 Serine/threonine-protein kinase STN7, chloroplastic [Gracilariopsis chorda]